MKDLRGFEFFKIIFEFNAFHLRYSNSCIQGLLNKSAVRVHCTENGAHNIIFLSLFPDPDTCRESSRVLLDRPVQVADINYVGERRILHVHTVERRISSDAATFKRGSFGENIWGDEGEFSDVCGTSGGNRAFHVQNGSTRHFHSASVPSKVRRNVCEARNSVSPLMLADSASGTRHLVYVAVVGGHTKHYLCAMWL